MSLTDVVRELVNAVFTHEEHRDGLHAQLDEHEQNEAASKLNAQFAHSDVSRETSAGPDADNTDDKGTQGGVSDGAHE
jgi:hypothetical protein